MSYRSDLSLFFHTASFSTQNSAQPNTPISLSYIGDSATPKSRPLTTTKRFFLQLLRAHVLCLPQHSTRISTLLDVVSKTWSTALAVSEGVRRLEQDHMAEEAILSDERMAIITTLLLPKLQTKVRATFEIVVAAPVTEGESVQARIKTDAKVVYGEKYKEGKMAEFLAEKVGEVVKSKTEMGVWADAVMDLKARLIARGRKG